MKKTGRGSPAPGQHAFQSALNDPSKCIILHVEECKAHAHLCSPGGSVAGRHPVASMVQSIPTRPPGRTRYVTKTRAWPSVVPPVPPSTSCSPANAEPRGWPSAPSPASCPPDGPIAAAAAIADEASQCVPPTSLTPAPSCPPLLPPLPLPCAMGRGLRVQRQQTSTTPPPPPLPMPPPLPTSSTSTSTGPAEDARECVG